MEELARMRESEVSKLHGMGPAGLRLLREAMAAKGCASPKTKQTGYNEA